MINKIENNKLRNKRIFNARKIINNNSGLKCLICGKSVSSFCHSHSVPISIFKKMDLKNKKLCSHETICQSRVITSIYSGKENSGIFKNICRECDRDFFKKLDNINVSKENWNNEELRLQSIRILLYEIYRKQEFILIFKEEFEQHLSKQELDFNIYYTNEQISNLTDEFYNLLKNDKQEFDVIFEHNLNYKANFSCVTLLSINLTPVDYTFVVNSENDTLNIVSIVEESYMGHNINLSKDDKLGNVLYLVVLPTEMGTKVILYSNRNNVTGMYLKMEFNDLQRNEKLEKISSLLSVWGNNIYGNETFFKQFSEYKGYLDIQRKNRINNIYSMKISDVVDLYNIMEKNKYNLFKKDF